MGEQGPAAGSGRALLSAGLAVKLDQLTNFPWAISEDGVISQARFETEAAAQIAYRSHSLGRRGK